MRIFILFTLAATIISCSNSTGTEPEPDPVEIEYPVIAGAFRINGPDEADWIGRPVKQKNTLQNDSTFSDTLYLSRPDGTSLRVWNVPVDSTSKWKGTMLSFVDSTLNTPLPKYDPEIHEVRTDPENTPPTFYSFLMYETSASIIPPSWEEDSNCRSSSFICVDEEKEQQNIFQADIKLFYHCGAGGFDFEFTIWLYYVYDHYYLPPDPLNPLHTGLHTKYVIDVSGLHQTIEHIQCGEPII